MASSPSDAALSRGGSRNASATTIDARTGARDTMRNSEAKNDGGRPSRPPPDGDSAADRRAGERRVALERGQDAVGDLIARDGRAREDRLEALLELRAD